MKRSRLSGAICAALFAFVAVSARAAPVSFDFDFVFTEVDGGYSPNIQAGYTVSGSFVYDTDEASADVADTTPGSIPGHEYSSRYSFDGLPYGADFTIPSLGDGFSHAGIEVLVNDSLFLTSEETGGLLPTGTYDWIELLASTAVDVCPAGATCPPYTPGDGEEWTLAIFGPGDWFSDGSLIPDTLPGDYTALLVGFTFDANGDEVAAAFASAVPVPAAAWLFASGLLGLVGVARHRQV